MSNNVLMSNVKCAMTIITIYSVYWNDLFYYCVIYYNDTDI